MESDTKRLVANAKAYNETDSEVWDDAERLRKIISNFMRKHNPAYQDPKYVAFPTPIPGDDQDEGEAIQNTAHDYSLNNGTPAVAASITPSQPPAADGRHNGSGNMSAASSSSPRPREGVSRLVGKTFQEAQEAIIAEMIALQDDE